MAESRYYENDEGTGQQQPVGEADDLRSALSQEIEGVQKHMNALRTHSESQALLHTESTLPQERFCNRRKISCCLEISLFLFGVACIVQLFFVPNYVKNQWQQAVEDRLIITASKQRKNNTAYRRWVDNTWGDAGLFVFVSLCF